MNVGVDYFLKYGTHDRKALAYYLRAVVRQDNKSGSEAEWASDLLLATKEIKGSDNHMLAALINLRYAVVLNEGRLASVAGDCSDQFVAPVAVPWG